MAAIAVSLTALSGCGLQSGPAARGASILVSASFGVRTVGHAAQPAIPSGETVLQYLRRSFTVITRPGAQPGSPTVVSIDGHRATAGLRWSVYDNGIALAKNAAKTSVHAGDHIWWDLHPTSAILQSPAVVGSYPEPFRSGIGGQKLPTLLQCAPNVTAACNIVARALKQDGVKVAFQGLGTGSGSDSLAVLVGTFSTIQGSIAGELVGKGPSKSGVFAQFVGNGTRVLELDNPLGQVTGSLDGTAGLIAATDEPDLNEPAWLITGTDPSGVREAAAALRPSLLRDHYALAVAGARDVPLPTTTVGL